MSKNSISTNQEILHGESLVSVNGKFKAVFQIDCNLVIYEGVSPIWHSDTSQSTGLRLVLQDNGILVMHTQKKHPVWLSHKKSDALSQRMRLTLSDHGHLEITRDGDLAWTSENSKGFKP